jgi:PAS domain S-box-containing protein
MDAHPPPHIGDWPGQDELQQLILGSDLLGIYYLDSNSNIVYVNQQFCSMLEVEAAELLGKSLWTAVLSANYGPARRQLELAYQLKTPCFTQEECYYLHDGSSRWLRNTIYPLWTANGSHRLTVVLATPINGPSDPVTTINRGHDRLRAIMKALPDIKLLVNEQGFVMDAFAPAHELDPLDIRLEQIKYTYLWNWMPPPVAQGIRYNIGQAVVELADLRQFEFVWPKQPRLLYFEARILALEPTEIMVVLRNLTQTKNAEQAIQQQLQELDIQNKKLQAYIDSNLELENFAYIASHDLREPLRTIRTFAQLLEKKQGQKLDEEARQYLYFIAHGANQLNDLIEDLLLYSRVNTEKQTAADINMQLLMEDIEKMITRYVVEKNARISYQNLPVTIRGSYTQLHQLFMNLIVNGIKFGPLQESPHIDISCRESADCWHFSVADNGIGIAPEFHETIFLLFKKLHPTGDYSGTGIGLALCKKIVELHGGEISVSSAPGKGATFSFSIRKEIPATTGSLDT